ncbi:MAG: hypothetical protein WC873_02690 [Candidatus Gracilibacteria bacterium]
MKHRKYISIVTAALIVTAAVVSWFVYSVTQRTTDNPYFFFETPHSAPSISEPITPPPED